jgi:hypothetical protein
MDDENYIHLSSLNPDEMAGSARQYYGIFKNVENGRILVPCLIVSKIQYLHFQI